MPKHHVAEMKFGTVALHGLADRTVSIAEIFPHRQRRIAFAPLTRKARQGADEIGAK